MTYGSCRRDRCWRRAISRFPCLNCRRISGEETGGPGAILNGEFERIIVPEGNLLDVNWRELQHAFPGHPMFENARRSFDTSRRGYRTLMSLLPFRRGRTL